MSDVKSIKTNIQTSMNLIKNSPKYPNNLDDIKTLTVGDEIAKDIMEFEETVKDYYTKITDIEQLEGGMQGELITLFDEYIKNPEVHQILFKYFGDNYTDEDVELLFYRINMAGCGYVAVTNILMDYAIENYTEEEFEEIFGFSMYRDKQKTLGNHEGCERIPKNLNTGLMTLDFFLYYATNFDGNDTIEKIYGNSAQEVKSGDMDSSDRTGTAGTYSHEVGIIFQDYLREKGINVDIINMYSDIGDGQFDEKTLVPVHVDNVDVDYYKEIASENDAKLVIDAYDFTLYLPFDKDNNGKLDDVIKENCGGHAMTVVGVTNDGKFLVDSWGQQYVLDPEEVNADGVKVIHNYCVYKFE